MKRFRKSVLLLLLLVAPLQGVAATLTAIACTGPTEHAQQLHAAHHASNAGQEHLHQEPQDQQHQHDADTSHQGHLCCQGFAVLPVVSVAPGGGEPRGFDPQYRLTQWLFYPEQPQPVPLA